MLESDSYESKGVMCETLRNVGEVKKQTKGQKMKMEKEKKESKILHANIDVIITAKMEL